MIRMLWDRFGFYAILLVVAGLVLFAVLPKPVPESPAVQMDMKKLILYERTLNADVLFVQEDENGVEEIAVLWNDDWMEPDELVAFTEKYDPITVIIYDPAGAIVEVDGIQHYGSIYIGVAKVFCIDTVCDIEPLAGTMNDPDAVDWDWGRR